MVLKGLLLAALVIIVTTGCSSGKIDCVLPGVTSHFTGAVKVLGPCADASGHAPDELPPLCGGASEAQAHVEDYYPFRSGQCNAVGAFVVRLVSASDRLDDCVLTAYIDQETQDRLRAKGQSLTGARADVDPGSRCVLVRATGSFTMDITRGSLIVSTSSLTLSLTGSSGEVLEFSGRRRATEPP